MGLFSRKRRSNVDEENAKPQPSVEMSPLTIWVAIMIAATAIIGLGWVLAKLT